MARDAERISAPGFGPPLFALSLSLFSISLPPPSFYVIHLISLHENANHNEGLGRIIRSC